MLQLFGKPNAGPQMIHRYYDEWKLAGLDFTEDYGVNVAVFGSSPSAASDAAKNDNVRVRITSGLDSDLLRARKSSTTSQRLTLAEIAARFGASGSGSWGLPKADVNVQQYVFSTESELALLPAQYNRDILNNWYGSGSNTLAQLVIAREMTQRNLGLESALMQPEKDGVFMINADPNQVPKQITAGYSLTPFEKTAGAWRTQAMQAFADSVSSEYRRIFKADPPTGVNTNDSKQLDAAAFIARNALVSMALSAPTAPVQLGPSAGFDLETPAAKWIAGSGMAIKGVVDEISGQLVGVLDNLVGQSTALLNVVRSTTGDVGDSVSKSLKRGFDNSKFRNSANKWDELGNALGNRELTNAFKDAGKNKLGSLKKIFKSEMTKSLTLGGLALATVTASVVAIALGDNAWATGVSTALNVMSALVALNDALNIRKAYVAFKALKDTTNSLYSSLKGTISATARAAKIGAVIGAVIVGGD
ncbi:MAG: hypothetical protein HC853_11905 [Anaerolineae bacterium]|nr:hypothetical protein [Anaerolineae bacterium]